MKPKLTEEQKENFEQEFRRIIAEAPEEIRNKWDGQIIWAPLDEPMFEGNIQYELTGRLADKYVILLNKLKDRRI
jgi:DNA-binding HxlR family transcriptional regulator